MRASGPGVVGSTMHPSTRMRTQRRTGFKDAPVSPKGAFFDEKLGEFLLPYDEVRNAADPEASLLSFLQSTYEAAAETAHWDRAVLETRFA